MADDDMPIAGLSSPVQAPTDEPTWDEMVMQVHRSLTLLERAKAIMMANDLVIESWELDGPIAEAKRFWRRIGA